MIQMQLGKDARIVSGTLPKIGETIYIESLGHAIVEGLFHNHLDNFIKLYLLETILGEVRQELPFSIVSPSINGLKQ